MGTEKKQHVFTIKEDFTEEMTCEMDLEGKWGFDSKEGETFHTHRTVDITVHIKV